MGSCKVKTKTQLQMIAIPPDKYIKQTSSLSWYIQDMPNVKMDHPNIMREKLDQMSTGMDQQQQQPKQQQIEWRRGRVLEISSQERTEREVAVMLQ